MSRNGWLTPAVVSTCSLQSEIEMVHVVGQWQSVKRCSTLAACLLQLQILIIDHSQCAQAITASTLILFTIAIFWSRCVPHLCWIWLFYCTASCTPTECYWFSWCNWIFSAFEELIFPSFFCLPSNYAPIDENWAYLEIFRERLLILWSWNTSPSMPSCSRGCVVCCLLCLRADPERFVFYCLLYSKHICGINRRLLFGWNVQPAKLVVVKKMEPLFMRAWTDNSQWPCCRYTKFVFIMSHWRSCYAMLCQHPWPYYWIYCVFDP